MPNNYKLLWILFYGCLSNIVFAENSVKEIHFVGSEIEDYANRDGSGLYFEEFKAVFEPHGIKLNIDIVPPKRATAMVNNNKADCMWDIFANEEKNLLYPRWPNDSDDISAIYLKSKGIDWQGVDTLAKHSLVQIRGYKLESQFKETLGKMTEVSGEEQAIQMVTSGRVDIYIDSSFSINNVLEELKLDPANYEIQYVKNNYLYFVCANNEKSKEIARIWDAEFPKLMKSGKIKAMFEKWEAMEYYNLLQKFE